MKNSLSARFLFSILFLSIFIWGCRDESKKAIVVSEPEPRATEVVSQPVRVQHILIAFQGSIPSKKVERTKEEAEKLANEILSKAKAEPAKFEDLVRAYSDDQVPGIYEMVDFGKAPNEKQLSRGSMVKGFGDLAFQLKMNEVGFLNFDPQKSPYGYHIMKRLQP